MPWRPLLQLLRLSYLLVKGAIMLYLLVYRRSLLPQCWSRRETAVEDIMENVWLGLDGQPAEAR
jgi:hypothetical protein